MKENPPARQFTASPVDSAHTEKLTVTYRSVRSSATKRLYFSSTSIAATPWLTRKDFSMPNLGRLANRPHQCRTTCMNLYVRKIEEDLVCLESSSHSENFAVKAGLALLRIALRKAEYCRFLSSRGMSLGASVKLYIYVAYVNAWPAAKSCPYIVASPPQ